MRAARTDNQVYSRTCTKVHTHGESGNPRIVAAPSAAALHESHYPTPADTADGSALSLRHTALNRPGEQPHVTVSLTSFDRSSPGPPALRITPPERLRMGGNVAGEHGAPAG
jgi:hypothetical protein